MTSNLRGIMLEYFSPGETVYDIVYPFLFFIKWCGLLPVTMIGERSNGQVKTTIRDWMYLSIFIIGSFGVLFVNLIYDTNMTRFKSALINHGNTLATLVASINLILTIIMNAKERFNIWNCLNKFHQFDLKV